jgi:hypothetical protein
MRGDGGDGGVYERGWGDGGVYERGWGDGGVYERGWGVGGGQAITSSLSYSHA